MRSSENGGSNDSKLLAVLAAATVATACGRHRPETTSFASASPPRTKPTLTSEATSIPRQAAHARPPRLLRCLVSHYGGVPVEVDGRWWLELGAGRGRLPFDDGRTKTVDTRLESPDLEDMLAVPYPAGPIEPISKPNGDPGRARVTALLALVYGEGERAVHHELVSVRLGAGSVSVHRKIAPALERVVGRLKPLLESEPALRALFAHPGGGFAYRKIDGTDRLSGHAFGIAVDLDPKHGSYHRWHGAGFKWKNEIPASIVSIFESEGFIWGGRWYHYDTIHFEYRPELLDPECRPRGNDDGY